MNEPSTSQQSDLSLSQVFVDEAGVSKRVFVEAGGISFRPQLVRRLKKAGATICNDPKQAEIILVDSSSDQGKVFIRDWGDDDTTVVLEFRWASQCIKEQRLLGENENWGGFLAKYDGPLPDSVPIKEEGETSNAFLPTPRITPVEAAPSIQLKEQPPLPLTSTHQPPRPAYSETGSLSHHLPSGPTGMPTAPAHYGYGPSAQHGQYPQAHQPPSTMPPYHQQPPIAQYPHGQSPEAHGLVPFMPLQQGHNPIQFPHSLLASLGHQHAQGNQMELTMALMDAITQAGFGPQGISQSQYGYHQAPYFNGQHIAPPAPSSLNTFEGPLGVSGSNTHMTNSSRSTPSMGQPRSISPPSGMLPPSFRRKSPKSPPASSTTPRVSKGKHRAMSPSPRDKPPSYIGPSRTPQNTSPASSSQSGANLFKSETGEELAFFVQIDLDKRFSVVSAIKKHGGKICNDHLVADYAILYSRSKSFKSLLASTLAAGRPAISAHFVNDSVAQNTLLDLTDYLFGGIPSTASKNKKKKRSTKQALASSEDENEAAHAEDRRLAKNKRQRERNEKTTARREACVKEENLKVEEHTERLPRSPTPPSEHTRVMMGSGNFRYSEHEHDFVRRYVDVLLERDHRMSKHSIAQCIARKVPTHTLKAWNTYLGNTFRDEFENIRKRKSIAYRKAESAKEAEMKRAAAEEGVVAEERSVSRVQAETSPSGTLGWPEDEEAKHRRLHEEDLRNVSHFFANGGDKVSEDDAVIWDQLTQQVHCQTMSDWEAFYNTHHLEVMARYEKLIQSDVSDDISAGPTSDWRPDLESTYA